MELSSEISQKSAEALGRLIPTKSSSRYEKEYALFLEWRKKYKVEENVTEKVMLAYFFDLVRVIQ